MTTPLAESERKRALDALTSWWRDNHQTYRDQLGRNRETFEAVNTAWLAAWQASREAQWQPIETAPKDGTSFIAWPVWSGENSSAEVYWHKSARIEEWRVAHMNFTPRNITHWRPIPQAPEKP